MARKCNDYITWPIELPHEETMEMLAGDDRDEGVEWVARDQRCDAMSASRVGG